MFCEQCGNELNTASEFCIYCGAKQPSAPEVPIQSAPQLAYTAGQSAAPGRSKSKTLFFGIGGAILGAALLAGILLVSGVFSSGGGKIEGPGFSTPEDAAKAYLSGLRELDMDAMTAAFAVESYVDHYDFEAMAERM